MSRALRARLRATVRAAAPVAAADFGRADLRLALSRVGEQASPDDEQYMLRNPWSRAIILNIQTAHWFEGGF